jgi:hypothetical protein
MMIHWSRFNIYLVLALASGSICGCQTEARKRDKVVAALLVHEEATPGPNSPSKQVSIFPSHPVTFTVAKEPFLTEKFVKEARVVNVVGGFALQLQFDRQGAWLLEQYSTSKHGMRIAIFCQFCNPLEAKLNEGRWLAAPKMQARITDGLIVFTPDATREEAERIVLGLNNVAKKLGTGTEWNP